MSDAPAAATPLRGWLWITWPLLAIGIAWLYFLAGAYYGIYVTEIRVSSLLIVAVVLMAWSLVALRSPRWRPRSVLAPAIAIALGAMAVSALTSRNPRISLDFVAYAVLLAGLYLLLRTLLVDPALRRRIGSVVVILGVVLCIAYLLVILGRWLAWWDLVGRFAIPPLRPYFEGLTYGNPGLVSAMAVLTWLVAAGVIGLESPRARAALIGLGSLVLAVVIVSGTRGAWLAVAATVGVGLLLLVAPGGDRRRAAAALRTRAGRTGLVVVAVIAVLLAVTLGPLVLARVADSGEGGRTSYWAASVRMFVDAPFAGIGVGMWAPERLAHTVAPELDYYIPHAHNVYLQVAAELGVVGIAAGIAIVVLVGRMVLGAFRGADAERRRWAVVAILATVYFGVHQVTDVLVNIPAALFMFALPFAWLDATAPGGRADRAASRAPVLAAAGILAVAAAVGWGLWSEGSALTFAHSQAAAGDGAWAESLTEAESAVRLDPSLAVHQLGLGLAAARAGHPEEAAAALEAATARDDVPTAWLALAWLRSLGGDATGARDALESALRLGGQQPALALAGGFAYEAMGDISEADHWYSEAIRLMPRLAGDPYWTEPTRSDRWASIRDTALGALEPADQVDLWLSEGDLERARGAAATVIDPEARHILELAVDAWGGDEAADAELKALAVDRPRDTTILGWCARLAAHVGDFDRAAAYRAWANTVSPNAGFLGLEVEVTPDPEPHAPLAGATWLPYGIYTYRRPTNANQVLPGLPHIVWTDRR